MYGTRKKQLIERTLTDAGLWVEAIATLVQGNIHQKPSAGLFGSLIHRMIYPRFIAGVHEADRKFTVDDRCTSCGRCAEVCPVENIRLEEGRPVWLHHCEQCMACIQLCPAEAIQAGKKTEETGTVSSPGGHDQGSQVMPSLRQMLMFERPVIRADKNCLSLGMLLKTI